MPTFYQTCLQAHLSASEYLTLQLLILLLQTHRQVCLAKLASLFPQPITCESRRRNLQRFLQIPQLSVKLLWLPIIKQILKQELKAKPQNRQARRAKQKGLMHDGYVLLVIDRTQWRKRNLMVASLVWNKHALPIYWQYLLQKGNSNYQQQKALLSPTISLLKSYPVVVLGDREFHSVKLAAWLRSKGVKFVLRQKCSTHIQTLDADYQPLKQLNIKPGTSQLIRNIHCTQSHQLGVFNLGITWQRKYGKRPAGREPWYLLTNLDDLAITLSCYRARWGIESMFKDCKSGGYNLEDTWVSAPRFMALVLLVAMAYTLATFFGQNLQALQIQRYACRLTEIQRSISRHSDFWTGLYGRLWLVAMDIWSELAVALVKLKPHKRRNFQQGFHALSLFQSAL